MLHLFGAPDFYEGKNPNSYLYAKYCDENQVEDIMNRTDDLYPFTDLDAYFLGLTDHAKELDEYSFGVSEHFKDKEN